MSFLVCLDENLIPTPPDQIRRSDLHATAILSHLRRCLSRYAQLISESLQRYNIVRTLVIWIEQKFGSDAFN